MISNKNNFSTLKNIKENSEELFYQKFSNNKKELFSLKNTGGLRKNKLFKSSEKNKPLISIITVCYNSEKTLERSIQSVLNQNYENIEYILIDGNSSDNTLNIINKYNDCIDLWVSEKDNGIYDAMNKGILLSSGEIIGILNSDDEYTSNALTLVNRYFTEKNIDFLFGSVKKDRLLSGFHHKKISWKFNIYPAHSSGFFISQKAQITAGLYDNNFKLHADYDLIYRLVNKQMFKGVAMTRDHITGVFSNFGTSSKESSYDYFYEEFKIRKKNNQNIFFITLLFVAKIIYNQLYKVKILKKIFYKLRKIFRY